MKSLLSIILCFINSSVFAQVNMTSSDIVQESQLNKTLSKLGFSYGLTYLGPSLDSNAQDGATYNRFKTGQDFNGNDTSGIASQQLYHTTALSYKLSQNITLSYTYTFQDDLYKGIEFDTTNWDGSTITGNERIQGLSYNNQRINAFVTNIYSNNYFFLMSNFYFERPTTEESINADMTYGLGVQPLIGIFTPFNYLAFGLKASIERDYYKRQAYIYSCGIYTCSNKYQTLRASLGAYLNYTVNDQLYINSSVTFDWDQMGDQVDDNSLVLSSFDSKLQLGDFNSNMDDVFEIGPKYFINKNLSIGAKIQTVITDPRPQKSAFIGNFNMSI